MIFFIFSVISILAAAGAAFVSNMRKAVIALWLSGLSAGGVYLSLGAEILAITQWIVSTLVAISFMFYAVMFGEYEGVESGERKQGVASYVVPLLVAGSFSVLVALGGGMVQPALVSNWSAPEVMQQQPGEKLSYLGSLGKLLMNDYILPIEILGLSLLLLTIGAGVIARPEVSE